MEPIRFGKGKRTQLKIVKVDRKKPTVPEEFEKYKYIRAWGTMMRSFEYFIRNQQRQALIEGAPADAVYLNSVDQHWVTYDELNTELQSIINKIAEENQND